MTIEEKASAYAEKVAGNTVIRYVLKEAYKDGMTEALASQWVSVEDRLPEEDVRILGCNKESVYLCTYDGEDFYNVMPDFKVRPTHWMPIPELPTKGGEE